MPTKKDIEEIVQLYKDQVETYKELLTKEREDKQNLQEQVLRLQDALVNIRAPEAYRDQQNDKFVDEPVDDEYKRKARLYSSVTEKYINGLEDPMFKDADDMIDMLESVALQNGPKEPDSLHENSES